MMRAVNMTFGLLAVGILGYAAFHYVTDSDPPLGEALVIDAPDRDLGCQPSGAEFLVRFRLTNTSLQPIRVVGLIPG